MLNSLYENSITNRAVETLKRWYACGLLAAMGACFKRAYQSSGTGRVVRRLLGGDTSATKNSVFYKASCRVNVWLKEMGVLYSQAIGGSLTGRALRAIRLGDSSVYKLLFGKGAQRFIIVLFALYLPLDWFLRSYSPINIIASLWDEALLVYGLAYVLFSRMVRPKESRANPLDSPLMAFLGICIMLLGVVSPMMGVALDGFRATVQYMMWFFVLTRIIETDRDAEVFAFVLAAIGVGTALHGVYQYIVAAPIPSHWVMQAETQVRTRVYSIFGSPNIMGSYMVMVAPIALSYSYRTKNLWIRLASVAATGLMATACLLTMTRGAWLGFAVAAAVFAWLRDKRLIALMLLGLGGAVFLLPDVVSRITFLFTDEFAHASRFGGRVGRAREGYRLLNSVNPWFGYGMGRFGGAVAMQNQTDPKLAYFYLDNYYIKTVVELGYIGMAGYVMLLAATLWNGMRGIYRRKTSNVHPLMAGVIAGMAGVLTHCSTENVFEVPYMNAYFWGGAALLMWFGFLSKSKQVNPS